MSFLLIPALDNLLSGGGGGPVAPGVFDYLRPASADRYLRLDGTSLYKRQAPVIFDYFRPASADKYLQPDGTSFYKRQA